MGDPDGGPVQAGSGGRHRRVGAVMSPLVSGHSLGAAGSSNQTVSLVRMNGWLLWACLWTLHAPPVRTATFKLALIGPWSCDPMFSRAMPTAAANLALSRLQNDKGLRGGYRYDLKLLEEDCSASKGSPGLSYLTFHHSQRKTFRLKSRNRLQWCELK